MVSVSTFSLIYTLLSSDLFKTITRVVVEYSADFSPTPVALHVIQNSSVIGQVGELETCGTITLSLLMLMSHNVET